MGAESLDQNVSLFISVASLYHALYHATVRRHGKVGDDISNSEMLMGEIKAENIRKYLKLVHISKNKYRIKDWEKNTQIFQT